MSLTPFGPKVPELRKIMSYICGELVDRLRSDVRDHTTYCCLLLFLYIALSSLFVISESQAISLYTTEMLMKKKKLLLYGYQR